MQRWVVTAKTPHIKNFYCCIPLSVTASNSGITAHIQKPSGLTPRFLHKHLPPNWGHKHDFHTPGRSHLI